MMKKERMTNMGLKINRLTALEVDEKGADNLKATAGLINTIWIGLDSHNVVEDTEFNTYDDEELKEIIHFLFSLSENHIHVKGKVD